MLHLNLIFQLKQKKKCTTTGFDFKYNIISIFYTLFLKEAVKNNSSFLKKIKKYCPAN